MASVWAWIHIASNPSNRMCVVCSLEVCSNAFHFEYTSIKFSFNIIANKQNMQSKCTFDHLNFFLFVRRTAELENQDGFFRHIKWSREAALKRIRFAYFHGRKCSECFIKRIIRWSTLWQLNRLSNDPVDCTFTANFYYVYFELQFRNWFHFELEIRCAFPHLKHLLFRC